MRAVVGDWLKDEGFASQHEVQVGGDLLHPPSVDAPGLAPGTREVGGAYGPVVDNVLDEVLEGGRSHNERCIHVQNAVCTATDEAGRSGPAGMGHGA